LPLVVETVTRTLNGCAVVMLLESGDTETVGVSLPALGVTKFRIFPLLEPVLFDARS